MLSNFQVQDDLFEGYPFGHADHCVFLKYLNSIFCYRDKLNVTYLSVHIFVQYVYLDEINCLYNY